MIEESSPSPIRLSICSSMRLPLGLLRNFQWSLLSIATVSSSPGHMIALHLPFGRARMSPLSFESRRWRQKSYPCCHVRLTSRQSDKTCGSWWCWWCCWLEVDGHAAPSETVSNDIGSSISISAVNSFGAFVYRLNDRLLTKSFVSMRGFKEFWQMQHGRIQPSKKLVKLIKRPNPHMRKTE